MSIACRLVWPPGALLGEGAWSASRDALFYVEGGAVHSYHPVSGCDETLAVWRLSALPVTFGTRISFPKFLGR